MSDDARRVLMVLPVLRTNPSAKELAEVADLAIDATHSALDELSGYSMIAREHSMTRDQEVFRMLPLTASFALMELRKDEEFERQARRRAKAVYGTSRADLLQAAKDLATRSMTTFARDFIESEILQLYPTDATAIYLRGQTYEKDLQYDLALQDYNTAFNHASSDRELITELALRILRLYRRGTRPSTEDMILKLRRAHDISHDTRLAVGLARLYEITDNKIEAIETYEYIFQNYSREHTAAWEEAVTYLYRYHKGQGNPKLLQNLVSAALKTCPESAVVRSLQRAGGWRGL